MIAITTEFNASYSRVGWRRRQVLRLGLPLLAVLDEQEATALLAHELAHAVNGDATTGFVVGSALYSLAQWHMMLRPDAFDRHVSRQRYVGIAAMLSNLFTTALAALVGLGISLLSHLLWRDSQRAEYLADSLAARAAGTEATLSLLDKMHLGATSHGIAQSLAASGGGDFFDALRLRSDAMPEHEWKRLRAMATLEASRLDATHPPTALRIALLEARPVSAPSVRLTGTLWRDVCAELARLEPATQQALLDQYRARLYC